MTMKRTMKLAVLSASAATTSAFVAPNRASSSTMLAMADGDDMSQALPFAPRPKLLDGSLPGDVGFDPFGLAGDDKASLNYMVSRFYCESLSGFFN
jgi:hypothetical protein